MCFGTHPFVSLIVLSFLATGTRVTCSVGVVLSVVSFGKDLRQADVEVPLRS